MKSLKYISLNLMFFFLLCQGWLPSSYAEINSESPPEPKEAEPWTGFLRDGQQINVNDLKQILTDHQKWIETNGKKGKRANLKEAKLQEANLSGANLQKANLQEANFQKANLREADLREVNLRDADLSGALLQKADLWQANLRNAILFKANLIEADFTHAYLQEVILRGANLQKADLWQANLKNADLGIANLVDAVLFAANLQEAKLSGANLQRADLRQASLINADLVQANLIEAHLIDANLQQADLRAANLQKANLEGTDLQKAILIGTDLTGAVLYQAILREAKLHNAVLEGCVFELEPNSLPTIPGIASAFNLSHLSFRDLPHSLVKPRKAFKESGLRKQEREITYAIKSTGLKKTLFSANLPSEYYKLIEPYLSWFLFDLTCSWGMAPFRPLGLLFFLVALFTIPYAVSITIKKKDDGIWKVWIPERVRTDLGQIKPELVRLNGLKALKAALYFSILSAFNIGWRDLNVGGWIARIQPREYRLQATGWVRSVSGLQSLISVYLLALTVLTYFGRPFESY